MSKFYTYEEFASKIASGYDNFVDEAVDKARNFYCGIYQSTPSWVLRRNPFVSPLIRKGVERMCSPTLPPPPSQPLTHLGGQCCDATYDVTVQYQVFRCTIAGTFTAGTVTVRGTGKVIGIYKGVFPPDARFSGIYVQFEDCQGQPTYRPVWDGGFDYSPNECSQPVAGGEDSDSWDGVRSIGKILSISLVSGLDNCGDPPGGYPELPPPDDDDITQPDTVIYEDNSRTLYDITINRDGDNYIFFPPVINVGGLAIAFNFVGIQIGGININAPSGGGGGGSPIETSDEIPEEPLDEDVLPDQEDGAEQSVQKLVGVKVDVTTIPVNNRSQSGNGSPNIIYAGWLEFKVRGGFAPRQRMDFASNYFEAPEDATGYAYCFKTGFKGTITVFRSS